MLETVVTAGAVFEARVCVNLLHTSRMAGAGYFFLCRAQSGEEGLSPQLQGCILTYSSTVNQAGPTLPGVSQLLGHHPQRL